MTEPPSVTPGLYDRSVLVMDPGFHTSRIIRASVDRDGTWVVTGSDDRTVRVWSLADGSLARTIRVPIGPGNVGKVHAVAISPDGELIAVGGWMSGHNRPDQIYIFDRATGAMVRRVPGLPNVVQNLVFSSDCEYLAATLGGRGGLRVYANQARWDEVACDPDYGDNSFGAAFAPDGRLATTSYDGTLRLYPASLQGTVRPEIAIPTKGGRRPFSVAFSPDGANLMVGYEDTTNVELVVGGELNTLPRPNEVGISNGNFARVAWSCDGATLFAAGRYPSGQGKRLLTWSASAGICPALPNWINTITTIAPLPGGDLLISSANPWLARLATDGTPRWVPHKSPVADFATQRGLTTSSDGRRIGFVYSANHYTSACFNVATSRLSILPTPDDDLAPPRRTGLNVEHWLNEIIPALNGKSLELEPLERSRDLAVHPSGDRFVLATNYYLHAFDAVGTKLWTRPGPSVAFAVNITPDSRLVIAAYQDGTIRWHRMSDGAELLAFMPLADQINWVLWTPEGIYDASPGAHGILRWHVNRGWDEAAESVRVADIPGFYRPGVHALVLRELETARALGLHDMQELKRSVQLRVNSRVPPGARLHVLTIGISAYQAPRLKLNHAHRDAHDLFSALLATQASLYTVRPQCLTDSDATRLGIRRALKAVQTNMEADDLAVVHFSGHGATLGNRHYLLPVETDPGDDETIKDSALPTDELLQELLPLAAKGRVLLLLDACRSGAAGRNADALRASLAGHNINVLASCQGDESAYEYEHLKHGAFTHAVLEALNDPAADIHRNGLINATGVLSYLERRVPELTAGKQTPAMEIRFTSTLFACGVWQAGA